MIKYLTFLTVIFGVFGDQEICSGSDKYCAEGDYCCGVKCCTPLAIPAITGIVIACIVFLCTAVACICFLVQLNKRKPGRTIQPRQGANVAVVGVHSTSSYYPPQNGYNQYPPPLTYNQAGSQYPPPPAYNQADSQYPPPPAYNQAGSQYPPPPAYNQFAALNAPSSQPPAFGQATPGFSQTAYPPPPSFNSVPTNNHEK
ncbi:uncharacterized protein LOC128231571 [Mya arenaria]|uniref:uncharacterized protein LOC128231571 n=1 Tax=Mya arenaria TaxID=6604 RepID=UPI0022E96338|nr:uncharacterized protein LOC128231571 [Mya arenaria]